MKCWYKYTKMTEVHKAVSLSPLTEPSWNEPNNPGMVGVGRDPEDHLIPTPHHGQLRTKLKLSTKPKAKVLG